jgi:hypothetical protein
LPVFLGPAARPLCCGYVSRRWHAGASYGSAD